LGELREKKGEETEENAVDFDFGDDLGAEVLVPACELCQTVFLGTRGTTSDGGNDVLGRVRDDVKRGVDEVRNQGKPHGCGEEPHHGQD
jgi:hypothetical protein